jgi:hypothetical protein
MGKSKALATVKVTPEQLIKDLEKQIELVDQVILEEMALEVKGTPSKCDGIGSYLYELRQHKDHLQSHLKQLVPPPPTLTARDVLETAMNYSLASQYQPNGKTPDEAKFDAYMKMAVAIASKLD